MQGLLGRDEVAHPQPDLAELVIRLAGVVGREGRELLACAPGLVLGVRPRAEEPHDLGAPDPADAGEAVDGLALAPARRRVGPFLASRVVRELAAGADHVAEHGAGRVRPELAADGRDGHLLEVLPALLEVAASDEDLAAPHDGPRLEVAVAGARTELDGASHVLERPVELTGVPRELGVSDREVAVRGGLGTVGEEALGAREPALGRRGLELGGVLATEREGAEGGPLDVAALQVRGVCALPGLDRAGRASGPP